MTSHHSVFKTSITSYNQVSKTLESKSQAGGAGDFLWTSAFRPFDSPGRRTSPQSPQCLSGGGKTANVDSMPYCEGSKQERQGETNKGRTGSEEGQGLQIYSTKNSNTASI